MVKSIFLEKIEVNMNELGFHFQESLFKTVRTLTA